MTTYQACCPDSKMVLLGYSQGAQVTADFLCGTSEVGFPASEAYASQVADVGASFFFFPFLPTHHHHLPAFPRRARRRGPRTCSPALANLIGKIAVDAVVLMGDPSFVKGQSWDRGNASNVSVSSLSSYPHRPLELVARISRVAPYPMCMDGTPGREKTC